MPLVRLSRDKRGFDTIYLLDAAPGRQGKLRVLYFWTAPTGVRVARDVLDDVRCQQLTRAFPQVTFDWPALLASLAAARQQAAAFTASEARREAWRGGAAKAGKGMRTAARAATDTEAADRPPVASDAVSPSADHPPTPTEGDAAASEQAGAPARSARRRKKRTRRPQSAGDAPSARSAPIIDT